MSAHGSIELGLEQEAWDRFVARTPGGTLFQSWDWGEARRAVGWNPQRLAVRDDDGAIQAVAQLGLRRLGPWRVAYCQRGPVWSDAASLGRMIETMRSFAAVAGATFIKINPDLAADDADLARLLAAGYTQTPSQAYMHRATYRVDLTLDEETLLKRMEGRTRRAIARARRDGVVVDAGASRELLERFERLLHATASRRPFAVPSHDLLRSLLERLGGDGRLRVSVARVGEADASAAVHLLHAGRCSYMWGGSTDDRVLMRSNASEALHWETMRAAKVAGCRVYDLHGTHLDAEGEPDGGTAFFKRGFGGELCRLTGDLEVSLKGGLYRLWQRLEPLYLRHKGGGS